MGLFKMEVGLWFLLILTCSCTKNISGLYSYQVGAPNSRFLFSKQLSLANDSTFKYKEVSYKERSMDVQENVYYYLGEGKYTVNNKQLILNFETKFRRIDSIALIPLSSDEVTAIKKNDKFHNFYENTCFIIFDIYFDRFSTGDPRPELQIGVIKVNERSITQLRNSMITYDTSKFPLTLKMNFEKFDMRYIMSLAQFPQESNFSNFNLGLLDETIKIQKPGYYKINIYISKGIYIARCETVINGTWTIPIRGFLGRVKISDMGKVKTLPKTE